ncbi:hypothetical protein BJY01DRAFT_208651 [Aspergillus pseudoustus]|uniref:Uncharacterized protein n=1 Tax=Aspergillus pseudoustus TaxID=1810923 RepID=A0ABR4KIC1_9EURO
MAATTQLPASAVASKLPSAEEAHEYEKILRISEDIFSGTHPRLKVPQQFVRKAASRNPPAPLTPQSKADEKAFSPPKGPSQYAAPVPKPASSHISYTVNGTPSTTVPSRILPKPVSEIDPIFLEKSDDLVRAELQLQRQRVERELREQVELKRQVSKQKVSIQDATPDFDVSEVLARALELVKPDTSPDGTGPGAPSDSFDENSFYSSRAPDSPQLGDRHHKRSSASSSNPEERGADVVGGRYSDELQRLEALNRPDSDQSMQNTYSIADHRTPQHRQPHRPEDTSAYRAQHVRQQVDPTEEPEYSPPAPGVAPMERVESYEPYRGYPQGPKRRFNPNHPDPYDDPRSASPPHRVRVVRNHITSPAAPQPSRVSPLAITKGPSVNQHHDARLEYHSEQRGSPEVVPTQPVISRKRRRLHDEKERGYRQGAGSVKPFIKEEAVSPPPFADTPPMYRARAPQEGPVYIDVSSPRYTPVVERKEPHPPLRTSTYEIESYDETHGDSGIQRAVSRLSTRRPMRDDQDLRRVASLHQARKPEYVREYLDQGSPHSARGPYTVVERLPHETTRYYEEPGAHPPRRYASPLPPQMTETYYNDYVVAPPPRRIVIDEHGNEYYETLPAPRVQAMPPPSSRIPRSDVYEGPPQIRRTSMRAASVLEDPYVRRRYVQEVPQGAYRRATDYARPTPSEGRPYPAPFAAQEPFPRSSSVQVHDYGSRQSHYMEETELPRERIVRVPSVRPPTTARYQEPREVIQRVESVHPGGRDMSVYMDEESRHPREYIERPPVYVATRPVAREERYYDNGEPERIVQLDGSRDVTHRAAQRY